MTKHLLIAGALVVGSFLALALGLSAAAGGTAEVPDDGGKAALGAYTVPASRALSPLQPAYATVSEATNPFTMRRAGEVRSTRLPFPPPPGLELPPLPFMPVSER
jgi:hypothetical protein